MNLVHEDSLRLSLLQFLLYDIFLATKYSVAQKEKELEYHGGSLITYAFHLHTVHKKWNNFAMNRHNREEVALLLINEGADLTKRDHFGKFPLHQAVRLYNVKIAERIIKKGGTLYLSRQDREDIIQLATEENKVIESLVGYHRDNYDKVIQLLRKKPFPGEVPFKDKFLNSCHALWRTAH